jgi:hypothetical protein
MAPDTNVAHATQAPPLASSVTATLNYLHPSKDKPARYLCERAPGLPTWTGVEDARDVAITDARPRAAEFTLDNAGFTLLRAPSVERSFTDEAAITGAYYDECARIVREATGACRVVVFDHTLRGPSLPRDPVLRVHNDYTDKSAIQRIIDLLPNEADELLKHRYVYINVWRPIAHTVLDQPLAFCDARSFTDDDLILTDLVYADRTGEIASVRFRPEHRWFYFSQMTPDEVALIKCYDTARDGRARGSFHSAFVDTTAPKDAPPRQSIEIRTIAFFKD